MVNGFRPVSHLNIQLWAGGTTLGLRAHLSGRQYASARAKISSEGAMTCRQRICPTALISFCLAAFFAVQAALAAEPKRVLLLYYSFGGNLVNATHFRAALERKSPELLEIYDAPLSTARPADEDAVARYADYLHALFPDQRLDLVVAVGASAVRLFQRYRRQHFPFTPMLAIAEGRRISISDLTENDVVVATSIDLAGVVANILQVLPDTTNVAVVVGNSPNERFWLEQMQATFQPFASRVSFTYFNDLSFDEILSRAGKLPPRSAIFHLMLLTDAAGTTHEDVTVLPRLYAVANAPMFSYYDINFGKGIVGGPLVSVHDKSEVAASVALRILRGEAARAIKLEPIGFSPPKFDWRQMQRWGISEARLPPGSEIFFRDPTPWEQYRTQILAVLTVLFIQAMLISWLIYEHRRRNHAEVLARNSMSELTHMNRLATAGELSASIAHEVNQPLTGIVTRASAARRWLTAEKPDINKVRAALDQIETAGHRASEIVASVRAMFKSDIENKSPIDINKLIWIVLGLVYIDLRKHQIDLQTDLDDGLSPVLGNQVQLQQVILNLIMNAIDAMRSAQPRALLVRSKLNGRDRVLISIEDTGIGIDPSKLNEVFKPLFTTKEHGMGMGLSICHAIIENHGGRIWVSPAATGGAIFQFELPTNASKN